MAQAECQETLRVEKDRLYQVITTYEDYPKFVEGCTRVQVDRSKSPRVQVTYDIQLMNQNISYTLEHEEDPGSGKVRWSLIESNFLKKNSGQWQLKSLGKAKTEVSYKIELEFKVPVPGFILNRLIKGSLPKMIKSFEEQALRGTS